MLKPVMFQCCCRQCPLLWCARKRRDPYERKPHCGGFGRKKKVEKNRSLAKPEELKLLLHILFKALPSNRGTFCFAFTQPVSQQDRNLWDASVCLCLSDSDVILTHYCRWKYSVTVDYWMHWLYLFWFSAWHNMVVQWLPLFPAGRPWGLILRSGAFCEDFACSAWVLFSRYSSSLSKSKMCTLDQFADPTCT